MEQSEENEKKEEIDDDEENDEKRHSQTNIHSPTNILAQDQRDINYKADEQLISRKKMRKLRLVLLMLLLYIKMSILDAKKDLSLHL